MVRILYTKYQLHISNGSEDIASANKRDGETEVVKGNNFVISGSIKKNTDLLIFHIGSIYQVSGSYTNWFLIYSRRFIFIKREITLAIFGALQPTVN